MNVPTEAWIEQENAIRNRIIVWNRTSRRWKSFTELNNDENSDSCRQIALQAQFDVF